MEMMSLNPQRPVPLNLLQSSTDGNETTTGHDTLTTKGIITPNGDELKHGHVTPRGDDVIVFSRFVSFERFSMSVRYLKNEKKCLASSCHFQSFQCQCALFNVLGDFWTGNIANWQWNEVKMQDEARHLLPFFT